MNLIAFLALTSALTLTLSECSGGEDGQWSSTNTRLAGRLGEPLPLMHELSPQTKSAVKGNSLSAKNRRHLIDTAKKVIGKTIEKVKDLFQQFKDFVLGKRDVESATGIIIKSSHVKGTGLSLKDRRHIIDTAKKVIGKTVEKVKDLLQQLKDFVLGKRNVEINIHDALFQLSQSVHTGIRSNGIQSLRDRRHIIDTAKKILGKTVEKVKDLLQQLKDFVLGKRDV